MVDWRRREWHGLCRMLVAGNDEPPDCDVDRFALYEETYDGLWPLVERLIDRAGGRWDASVTAALSERWSAPETGVEEPMAGYEHSDRLRHMRTAWHLVHRDHGRVPRGERQPVMAALANARRGATHLWDGPVPTRFLDGIDLTRLPGPPEVPEADAVTLPVAFPRRLKAGSRTRVAVRGTLVVERVPSDDSPVAVRLGVEAGGWLDVRSHEGTLFRPVLSPGSWEPVGLDRFAEACATGEPWLDAPHLVRPTRDDEVAFPLEDLVTSGIDMGRGSANRDEEAMRRCRERAGRLLVIDGVVHRPCPAPTIGLARHLGRRLQDPGAGMRFGWRLGRLGQFDSQGTYGRPEGFTFWAGVLGRTAGLPRFWVPVPLAAAHLMPGMVEGLRATQGHAPMPGANPGGYDGCLRLVPFEVLRPDLVQDGRPAMVEALRRWRRFRDRADFGGPFPLVTQQPGLEALLDRPDATPTAQDLRAASLEVAVTIRRSGDAAQIVERTLVAGLLEVASGLACGPVPEAQDEEVAAFSP